MSSASSSTTRASSGSASESARLTVEPCRPYALGPTIATFARFPEAVDHVEPNAYRRLILARGRPLLLSVEQLGPPSRAELRVRLEGRGARSREARAAARDFVETALGAALDVRPFYRAFRADPVLGSAIRAFPGLRVAGRPTAWEAIVTAILSQQVNLRFAYSIREELARAFGRRARFAGRTYVAFPTPERLAEESESRLREFRLSRAKAGTVLRIARAFTRGEISDATLRGLSDQDVIARLVEIKGLGRWTADTTLMRGLARPDAFPAGDLGVVKHLAQGLLGHDAPRTESEMRAFAERWRPHRALALTYAYAELRRRAARDRPAARPR
jgi:DNA-3-methyladenine glycosylase II